MNMERDENRPVGAKEGWEEWERAWWEEGLGGLGPIGVHIRRTDYDTSENTLIRGGVHVVPIAVHIRRTDYVNYPNTHPMLSPEYYRAALQVLRV